MKKKYHSLIIILVILFEWNNISSSYSNESNYGENSDRGKRSLYLHQINYHIDNNTLKIIWSFFIKEPIFISIKNQYNEIVYSLYIEEYNNNYTLIPYDYNWENGTITITLLRSQESIDLILI